HRRRRARPGPRMAAGARRRPRRQAAPAHPALARPAARVGAAGGDDDGCEGRLEREGEARARLAAALPELAAGLLRGPRLAAPACGPARVSQPGRRSCPSRWTYLRTRRVTLRVFVAGATGAIGRQLVPRLVAAGHEVHGMTRSEGKRALVASLGAVPVVADALDPDQVAEAVGRARPEVIVHELTAIPAGLNVRHLDREFALTNRLRTEGTDHLLSAGQALGVRRFVAQGVCGFGAYARTGGPVKTEEDALEASPAREMRETLAAIRRLEGAVLGASWTEGIVLRYGVLYG